MPEFFFTNPQLEGVCDIITPTRRMYGRPLHAEPELVACVTLPSPWGFFEVSLYTTEMVVHCPDPKDPERLATSLCFYHPKVEGSDLVFVI